MVPDTNILDPFPRDKGGKRVYRVRPAPRVLYFSKSIHFEPGQLVKLTDERAGLVGLGQAHNTTGLLD